MSGYNRKGRKPNGRGSGSSRSGRGSGRVYPSDRTSSIDQRIQSGFSGSPSKSWTTDYSPLAGVLGGQMDPGTTTTNSRSHKLFEQFASPDTNILQNLQAYVDRLNKSDEWTDERYDMYLQYLLQLISTADQRKFDRQQLEDSRLYSNPQNELARLMGSGISRDAAIQILSGSAGGSGVGSIIGSGQGVSVPSPTGIGGQLELEKQQTTANIVYGAVDALNQFLQTGMSMAQGIEQYKSLNLQNQLSQQNLDAFNSVNQVSQALQMMQSSGQIESSEFEKISNVNDLVKFLNDAAPNNEQLKQLISSRPYQTALGTQFGRDYMNKYMASMRDSRDAGTLFDEFVKQQKLATSLRELDISKAGAELQNINADTFFKNAQVKEIMSRICLNEAQVNYVNAETNLLGLQSDAQELTNANLRMEYELNDSGFPMLKQIYIDQLADTMAYWSTINDPTIRDQRISQWWQNERNANLAAYLENIRLNAVGDFANANPTMYRLMVAWHASGAADQFHATEQFAKYFKIGSKILPFGQQ